MYRLSINAPIRQRFAPTVAALGPFGSARHKSVLASLKESAETLNKKTGQALAGGIERTQDVARRLTGRSKASDTAAAAKDKTDRAAKATGGAGQAGQRDVNEAGGRKAS